MDVYKTREATNVEIAYARNEIAADVRDANVAQATNKLELAALIDGKRRTADNIIFINTLPNFKLSASSPEGVL